MTDNDTFRDMVEDLQHELNDINSKLRSLAFDLKIEREVHERPWAQKEKLERENEALRDIVRSAQYLVDVVHVQHNASLGGTFGEAISNLRAALRSWYQPNGTGR